MTITRYDPFRELRDLERKLFALGNGGERNNISSFAPSVNTREEDGAYSVEVDLPGVPKEDIHIDIHENVMTVSGERKHKAEIKEDDYYKLESYFGKFQRSFTLPDNANTDEIAAKYEDGVLMVTIPKVAPKEAKKISVA